MRYLVFDTETSNIPNADLSPSHPQQARIIQLAVLFLDDKFQELGVFSSLIKPSTDFKISDGAFKAHGIDIEKCRQNGIMITTALQIFNNWSSMADVVIAHNIQFDLRLVEIEQQIQFGGENGRLSLDGKEFCTMINMTPICKLPGKYGKYKWPKLQEAYMHCFGKPFDKAHDALADVRATASVYRWYQENCVTSQDRELMVSQ